LVRLFRDIYRVFCGDEKIYNFKKGDDSEYLYDHNSYPVQVFPPRFPVPDELKKSLHEAYLTWQFHPLIINELNRNSPHVKNEFYRLANMGLDMDKQGHINSSYTDKYVDFDAPEKEIARICNAIEEKQKGDEERLAMQCRRLVDKMEDYEWDD